MRKPLSFTAIVIALGIVTACSSSNENVGQQSDGIDTNAADCTCPLGRKHGGCLTLTPSNLPADICDTPGTKDFTGGRLDPNHPDAMIDQPGASPIFLYKFANVSGDIDYVSDGTVIVATNSMRVGSLTWIVSPPGSIRGGEGHDGASPHCGGGGAGHGTEGGPAGGGPAYGSETCIPLVGGSHGGWGLGSDSYQRAEGGYGGPAVQLVSCGTLLIEGAINADGQKGAPAFGGGGPGGGGGGSGGTILIEAARVTTTSNSHLSANGGDGGGGDVAPGGTGGTATSAPGASVCGYDDPYNFPGYQTGSGAGGAVGRIRINVAAGTQPQLLGSVSPVASVGTVATH